MLAFASVLLALAPAVLAQTWTACNPLQQTCAPNPALSQKLDVDFTKGGSKFFTSRGNPTYDSQGMHLVVAKSGDSPEIDATAYIMFGHVDVTMRAGAGAGIVSSIVLQSDDLDEIDWEWVGSDGANAQTNYFGKGITGNYDRGKTLPVADVFGTYHTYSIDWTSERIVWSVDGAPVRTLAYADASGGSQYPQSPMQLKIGAWSGGDPANPQGTINWAGGPTNYAAGPYTMYVKGLSLTDYSTGKSYSYGDHTGTWQSIKSDGGAVNGGPGAVGSGNGASGSNSQSSASSVSSVSVSSSIATTLATTTVAAATASTPAARVLANEATGTAASSVSRSTNAASPLSIGAGSSLVGVAALLMAFF